MRKFLIFSFILFFISSANAQDTTRKVTSIVGIVKDSLTLIPLPGVAINDKNRKASTYTSENGIFQIMAAPGDTLKFFSPSFFENTIIVASKKLRMDTIEIWLKPRVKEELPGVLVSNYTYKDYQLDSAERYKEFSEEVGFKTPTFSKASSGAGVGIGLDGLFSKKNKQKKEALKTFTKEEQERYIDFRFKPILVHQLSGLTGAKLSDFMHKYRPTYQWLRDNMDSDALKYYINDKLKVYFSRNK